MLYKKYCIEVTSINMMVSDVILRNNTYNNHLNFEIDPVRVSTFTKTYVNDNGINVNYFYKFNSYKDAYDVINKYYYCCCDSSKLISIIEVFDDIEPPLLYMRSEKIRQIKNKIKKHV